MLVVRWLAGYLYATILLPSTCWAQANKSKPLVALTSAEFLQILLLEQDYDNRIYPGSHRQVTTDVKVNLVIDSIDSVNDESMDFTLNFVLTQEWRDRRLRFHGLINKTEFELDAKMIKSVWVPDLYFANEKTAVYHDVTIPNIMMHLYKTGIVRYKSRVSLTAACLMNLQYFPLDSQKCSLVIRSFAYTRKMVDFFWREEDPVLLRSFQLPQFRLARWNTTQCPNESYVGDEDFSCIQADFFLDRQIGYYLIQLYIPSVLIVSLSWVSFWLTIDAVPARTSLGILTVLTMTTQKSSSGVTLPQVSYVKAIDVWMAICLVFVFAALLEYALVSVLSRRQRKRAKKLHGNNGVNSKSDMLTKVEEGQKDQNPFRQSSKRITLGVRQARTLDKVSRALFPLSYALFCAVYWIYYTLT